MRVLRLLLLAMFSLSMAAPTAWAQGRDADGDPLERALQKGDYDLARQIAMRHDDTPSLLARSKLAALEGDFAGAERFARVALEKASRAEHRQEALLAVAKIEIERGDWEAAEARLRDTLKAYPDAHGVRYQLGALLWRQGRHAEAKPMLDHFTTLYNNGNLKTARELTWLGLAMKTLGSFDDANYAFEQAYAADNEYVEGLVEWGMLFLEKYNLADANRTFEDALRVNARHPRALIGRAIVESMSSNRADGARALLDQAERVSPEEPELWLTRAHLAIRDSDCPSAREHAARILKHRPRHLEAMSVGAICAYLEDDADGFAERKKRILALNPKYARLLAETGDYGVMVHRYVKAMDLYREALAIDPDNAQALLGLGVGLSRINREDEALEYLRRAFEVDPYNVRAYNMLELYEKTMPSYSFGQYDDFKLRAHNGQFEMINMYVAPVIARALEVFDAKYGFEPERGLSVEVFPNPTTFSVRSVGLPHISPHGICFGRVVTVRSPSDGNFNWRQVVWHELAHVYHLQMSNARVPRWFTEGLAEYETNVWDDSWQRHHDRELAIKVFAGEIPSVLELDYGFTHARSHVEVLRSYHLASLAIHFIAETWGFDSIVAMLRAWGEKRTTPEVLAQVLEVDPAAFDEKFEAWLRHRLMTFENQLMLDIEALPSREELERQIKLNNLNARAHAQLALLFAMTGDMDAADASIERALEIARKDAEVHFMALHVRLRQRRPKLALEHGEAVLAQFQDSYELRYYMSRAARLEGDVEGAMVHLRAAVQLYDQGVDAWRDLATLAKNLEDEALYDRAAERVYMLNQHDPGLARERVRRHVAAGEFERAWGALKRWLDVNPFDPEVHRFVIEVAPKVGREPALARSWRALILLREAERDELYPRAIESLRAHGLDDDVAKFEKWAEEDGVAL